MTKVIERRQLELSSWGPTEIAYISIISPLLLAALVEWVLWLAAFLYCLTKVYQKADTRSVKALAIVMMALFILLRTVFLLVMVVTLPLPERTTFGIPRILIWFLQWFSFWTFAVLLVVPFLFCVYRLVTNSLGRESKIKHLFDERTAPKVVIVMPVYKEDPAVLIKAVDSVVHCDYPSSCIHVFLSYDGGLVDEPYLRVIHHLGIPLSLRTYPRFIDVTYKGARVTISRFKHGGKRYCQKQTFMLIDRIYQDYLTRHDNLFVLFIDSDCILHQSCLQNFIYDMELKPGSKHSMLAMTGVITSTTEKASLITVVQDIEYLHGQLFERSVESGCGAVTCLPGALTILRFSAFRKMAKYYFAEKAEQCEDIFDFGRCHLGEDRWLTHLFMVGARKPYQIQMCTNAFCKTEAVQTFHSLLKQRRRWFLGFITNEVCMLTDIRIWKRYPLLCLVRFLQNTIRTTALLFLVLVIAMIASPRRMQSLPVGFIVISLCLNYFLMFYFGAKLRRYKAWLYPILFLLNPFFNWVYMVYGIFTAGKRTWGGPRTDAAEADEMTSPEEAAEQARAQGDELNVNVDTFRHRADEREPIPIHPSKKVEGRFSQAEQVESGMYINDNASMSSLMSQMSQLPEIPRVSAEPFVSLDNLVVDDNMELTPGDREALRNEGNRRRMSVASQNADEVGDVGNEERAPSFDEESYYEASPEIHPQMSRRSSNNIPLERVVTARPEGSDHRPSELLNIRSAPGSMSNPKTQDTTTLNGRSVRRTLRRKSHRHSKQASVPENLV